MKHYQALIMIAALAVSITACGNTDQSTTTEKVTPSVTTDGVDRSKTIEFDGKKYTCGDALERPEQSCETDVQNAFNQWGDNLINYANSPFVSSGAWSSLSFADIGVAGLAACSFAEKDNAFGFTQYMKRFKNGEYGKNESDVSSLYIAATTALCPGV